jgi:hypothetical protein
MFDTSQVIAQKPVSELGDHLQLVSGSYEVNQILEVAGVEHDPDSIVLEDSFGCLFVDTAHGAYSEIWGVHKSVPYLDATARRVV